MASQYLIDDLLDERYRIDEIHKGNLGIVYLCTDIHSSKPIAIKTFEDRYLKTQANRMRFLDESVVWIELERHPNIVQAYGLILIDEKPYLLMERVMADNPRGATLKNYIFSRVVPMKNLMQIAIHICNGMNHALKKNPNLVHRDLKPENILIGADGNPKITDFGVTLRKIPYRKSVESNQSTNREQIVLSMLAHKLEGTPAFASPEQCMGRPLDTRSDIYSFGCILYLFTTKRLPFPGNSLEETIRAHIESTPARPWDLESTIPLFLDKLIMRCLRKKPENRYPDFQSLREELVMNYRQMYYEYPKIFEEEIPLSSEDYIQRAKTYFLLQRFSETGTELGQAARLTPQNPEIPWLQGKLFLHQKQFEKAIEFLKQALELQPGRAMIHERLGTAYFELDNPKDAITHFQAALDLDPTIPTVYEYLGRLYLQLKLYPKAEQLLQNGISCCPDDPQLYDLLAKVYQLEEKRKPERQTLIDAFQQGFGNLELLFRLIDLCNLLRDRKAEVKWLETAANQYPDSFQAWYRLGEWYETSKEWVKAVNAWSKAAIIGSEDADFHVKLASLCYRIMRYDPAWRFAVRAEELGADVEDLKRKIQIKRFKNIRDQNHESI